MTARPALVLAVLAVAAVFAFVVRDFRTHWSGEAFAAFYCAGETVAHGGDPYAIEPLRACEHRVGLASYAPPVVEPAPLPGYALVPFIALARLPYGVASALFVASVLASVVVAAALLARVAGVPFLGAFGALLVVDGYVAAYYGETPPLAIAALALAGWAVASGRDRLAGIAAAAAMIEPHLGLGACLALFVWRPRARGALALAGAACAAAFVAVLGPHGVVEYFASALPLQARAETPAPDQYSLTWLAHVAGASDDAAVRLGSASYLALLVASVGAAGSVARRRGAPALLVFFPCAATMLLGTFVHDIELPAAVPAALVLAGSLRGGAARFAWTAAGVLAVAWMPWWNLQHPVVALSVVALGCLGWAATAARPSPRRWAAAAGAAALYGVFLTAFVHLPAVALGAGPTPWPAIGELRPGMPSALVWGAALRADHTAVATLSLLLGKIVVWSALAGLLALAVAVPPSLPEGGRRA